VGIDVWFKCTILIQLLLSYLLRFYGFFNFLLFFEMQVV